MKTARPERARALFLFATLCTAAACNSSGGTTPPPDGSVRLDGSSSSDGRTGRDGPGTDGPPGTLCTDTCAFAGDDACDDGGPDSEFSVCDFGTDCTDCGPRNPGDCVPDCEGADCGPDGCGGTCGECAAGSMCDEFGSCMTCGCDGIGCGMDPCGTMDCGTCTDPATCYRSQCRMPMCEGRECGRDGAGGNCGTMMGMCPTDEGCRDGSCVACDCGTRECGFACGEPCGDMDGDCPTGEMCDRLTGMCSATPDAMCNNTCGTAGDGECDDGRPGSHFSLCEPGSDCADCGPLTST
jgi:hypothetical protein